MKKNITGYGDLCAGGMKPFNDGRMFKDGRCTACNRPLTPWKDGHIPPHVWAPKEELFGKAAKQVNPSVYNSDSNRAARAFQRTRKT